MCPSWYLSTGDDALPSGPPSYRVPVQLGDDIYQGSSVDSGSMSCTEATVPAYVDQAVGLLN